MMFVINIDAIVTKPIPLICWSGSFIAKIVKTYFPKNITECGFSLSPLIIDDRIVLSGVNGLDFVLDTGTKISFRFSSYCGNYLTIPEIMNILSNTDLNGFKTLSMNFQVFNSSIDMLKNCEICGEDKLVKFIDTRDRGLIEVFFGPTMLMFRGWRILYPSPQRIIYTLAKSSVKLLGVDPKLAKKRARTLSRNIDLIGFNTRPIKVFISRNRKVKAFMGKALLGVQNLENLRDFVELLELGRFVGVGRSRGLGFGYISYRVLEIG